MFSNRSGFDRQRNLLAAAQEEAARAGRSIIDLTISNPTLAELPYEKQQVLKAFRDPQALSYRPDPLGMLSAREVIARYMAERGIAIDARHILLTAGTSDAYAYLFKLLCDPGDQVFVPQPSYPLFEHLACLESVTPVPYRLHYNGRWLVSIDEIKKSLSPRVKALLIVSPNNPTGSFLKRDELRAIGELGLPIISDEVFSSYPLIEDATRVTSALECEQTLVFSLFGLSKLAALPQVKLSWMCCNGPRRLVDEALARLEIIADTFLAVGAPVQLALPRLLAAGEKTAEAIRVRTRRNLERLRSLEPAIELLNVEGGWYATLRLPEVKSDEEWALDLLNKDQVNVYPGYFFDFEEPSLIVTSLLTSEPLFDEGIRRLQARVAASKNGTQKF